MDESTNDGIVNVGDGNDGGAAMNPATGTEPAAQSTDAYSVTYAAAARLNDAPESAAPASVWDEMSHNPQPAAAATHENSRTYPITRSSPSRRSRSVSSPICARRWIRRPT